MRAMQEPHRARSLAFHPNAPAIVRFDPFRFDLAEGSLWRDGAEVRLPPRSMVILQHLVERAGAIVSKQALIDAGWKDAHVGEASLTEAIGIIRQALDDDPQQPRYIQTVHRRGYRFIAKIAGDTPSALHLRDVASVETPAEESIPAVTEATEAPPTPASGATAREARRGGGTMRPAVMIGAAVIVIAAAAIFWMARGDGPPPPVARLTLTLTPEQAPAPGLNAHPVATMTPDGQRVIYTAGAVGGERLFVRRMDRVEATPLAGTDGGHGPFVSPDGRWVAFFANGALRKTPIDGGEPQVICPVPTGVGGTWLSDEEIVFAPDWTSPLMRVRASSGSEPKLAAAPAAGYSYRWPDRIDEHTVIATRWHTSSRDAAVVALSLTPAETPDPRDDDDVEKVIAKAAVFARYVPTRASAVRAERHRPLGRVRRGQPRRDERAGAGGAQHPHRHDRRRAARDLAERHDAVDRRRRRAGPPRDVTARHVVHVRFRVPLPHRHRRSNRHQHRRPRRRSKARHRRRPPRPRRAERCAWSICRSRRA